jgi:multisubunit Na+/H+ antiporter MnhB subunit
MILLFDVLLALLVLALVLRLLIIHDLFQGVVLFISFGLAMTLVWVRTGSADVALAEVALGAGVTGALLVNTLRRLAAKSNGAIAIAAAPPRSALVPAVCGALATAAAVSVVFAARPRTPLAPLALDSVARTAVENPVTAVLLEFRAWDTLLEIGVLLAAATAVWALERGRVALPPRADAASEPVLAELIRWIVPLAVITALYLAWYGSYGPGGAFQAGALLAGAAVLMLAGGFMRPRGASSVALRCAAAAGLFGFAAVALHTAATSGHMLRYPAAGGYWWILGIELLLMLSIAAILADLFVDVPAAPLEDTR